MRDHMEITSLEQAKAMLHPLRHKLLEFLKQGPATPSEAGRAVGVAANKAHYHVHILEANGLVELVETRRVGSVTEKYYQSAARAFDGRIDGSRAAPDDLLAMLQSEVRSLLDDMQTYTRLVGSDAKRENAYLSITHTTAGPAERKDLDSYLAVMLGRFEKAIAETPGRRYRVMLALVPEEPRPEAAPDKEDPR